MNIYRKWGFGALLSLLLLGAYNSAQPNLYAMRANSAVYPGSKAKKEAYGPSLEWLDRAMSGRQGSAYKETRLDFRILSSMMVAGLASGFRSQVANLLWMQFDEYFHKGDTQRQIPIMEAVVTLDPQFVEAWSTIGWHWAYNIYAEVEDPKSRPELKGDPDKIRKE